MEKILADLADGQKYGFVLRAKGLVRCEGDKWIHFDYVPEEVNVRYGSAGVIGKLCVIGSKINEKAIETLFGV